MKTKKFFSTSITDIFRATKQKSSVFLFTTTIKANKTYQDNIKD